MRRRSAAGVVAGALLLCASCRRDEPAPVRETVAPPSPAPEAEVVATVGSESVTEDDVDERIRRQLFERMVASRGPETLKQYRDRALEEIIDELVLAREARRQGVSPEEVLRDGQVRDEQVVEYFERNRARFGGEDAVLDDRRFAEIRALLGEKRKRALLESLREEQAVAVDAPRADDRIGRTGFAIGPAGAAVTLVAFVDYQSASYRRTQPVLDALVARYPGELRLVLRHLPDTRAHPRARAAAAAAVCAEGQGAFPAYHERLLGNPYALADDDLRRYATELGLDAGAFATCVGSEATAERINDDRKAAAAAGLEVAPSYWLGGQAVPGPRPIDVFAKMIDNHLQRADRVARGSESW